MSGLTPTQTVGPYFAIALEWAGANRLVTDLTPGEHIVISGQVLDGDGEPVPDAMIEIWQADAGGHYGAAGDGFAGAGRCGADADGRYGFETIKPGPVAESDGPPQAPHINVAIFARGLLRHLYTRVYFEEEAEANSADAVMQCIPEARRSTLLARRDGDHYVFDIRLQGDAETVFLDV